MIQKSLSPVAKSRMSSSCGNTISVEYRSFARTAITSCCEYFTVRATPDCANTGNAMQTTNQRIASENLFLRSIRGIFICLLLLQAWAWVGFSSGHPRQHVEPLFESIGIERLFPFAVVEWVVCVEPVAFSVNREVCDLREFRGLNQKLLLGDKCRNEIDFVL